MSYQGERARPIATEAGRVFEVSKVRMGADGHVSDVLWAEVDASSDPGAIKAVLATAAEVVDALHDGAQVTALFPAEHRRPSRPFVVVAHADGQECVAFDGPPSPGRNVSDLDHLDGPDDLKE